MIDFIQPYFEQWGYAIVFLSRLLENSAFIGVVVPGDVVLLMAGFYAERGTLDLGPIMALSFVGALIGDSIGYVIGRVAGRRIVDRWGQRFWLPHDRLERFDRYFAEYGMWAVAVGRITPVVRTINTFAAGMTRMSFPRFFIAVVVAAGAWSIVVPVLGFFFSGSLDAVSRALGWVGVVVFALFVGGLYWSYRRTLKRIEAEGFTWRRAEADG